MPPRTGVARRITDLTGAELEIRLFRDANEVLNGVMFPFLLAIVEAFDGWQALKRAPLFRIGVRMHDSKYVKFWRSS